MILIDVNILLYASNTASNQHAAAHAWLGGQLDGTTRVGLPWASLLAFLRLATNPRAFPSPLTMDVAWQQVSQWLAADPVWTPEPTDQHAAVLGNLLALPGVMAISCRTPILRRLPSSTA